MPPELKEKISGMFGNHELVIKYQVFPEDLDALVSVRSDEDLHHMLEEYDRHESLPRSPSSCASRFRIFLFPSPSTATTPSSTSPTYLDAVNGSISIKGSINIPNPCRTPMFTISSSVCSSPPSTVESSPLHGLGLLGGAARSGRSGMQRVRSTPNLSGEGLLSQSGNSCSGGSPRGGRFYNPHHHNNHHHHHLQQHKGTSQKGGGCSFPGHQSQFPGHQSHKRHYYPPLGVSPWGHVDELHTLGSSHRSFNFSRSGTPPVLPQKKSIWE